MASLGNINNKNFMNNKKNKISNSNVLNLQNNKNNFHNNYGINNLISTKNRGINSSSKIKQTKNDIIINNNSIINNNFHNLNHLYNNNNNNINKDNQSNLINLNGINISYSELAKHLHSRKNTATNTKAKNSNENSQEKKHSSLKKINNSIQAASLKIIPNQNENNKTNVNKSNHDYDKEDSQKINRTKTNAAENILLRQDCFFNNSFKKKKRNASLKYNFSHGLNNISHILRNSSSNLNTSNSNCNVNASPNLCESYSFGNNSKTTKENTILNSMGNTMKGSNFYNFPSNNSFVNSSSNNLNNKSSIHFNCSNAGYNRNAYSKSNFLNNLNNNNLLTYNDSIKYLNFGKTNNPNDIEGPELLHFFYVNILHQNKKLAYKFENCPEENSVIMHENETNTFA